MKKVLIIAIVVLNVVSLSYLTFLRNGESFEIKTAVAEAGTCVHADTKFVRDPLPPWETDNNCSFEECQKQSWTGNEVCENCGMVVGTISGTSYKECTHYPGCGGGVQN